MQLFKCQRLASLLCANTEVFGHSLGEGDTMRSDGPVCSLRWWMCAKWGGRGGQAETEGQVHVWAFFSPITPPTPPHLHTALAEVRVQRSAWWLCVNPSAELWEAVDALRRLRRATLSVCWWKARWIYGRYSTWVLLWCVRPCAVSLWRLTLTWEVTPPLQEE